MAMNDTEDRLLGLRDELQRRLGKTQSEERRETAEDEDSNAQLWEASEIRDGLDDEAVGERRQVNRALERLKYDSVRNNLPISNVVSATIQERAWSSPIWYAPVQK